jgi:cytochrome o ubiquinol oxidase subunit 2
MHFDVQALPVADFAEWLRSAHTAGPMLDDASYTDLAKPTINVPPSMYGSVDAGLFRKIVLLDLAPGPGPATENAGADQAPLKGH